MSNLQTVKTPPPDPDSGQQLISLVDVFNIIRKRWLYGLIASVLVVLPFLIKMLPEDTVYKAEATMTIELTPENVMNIREVVQTEVTHFNMLRTVMNTHMERLRTRGLAEAVVAALTEEEREAFLRPYTPAPEDRDEDYTPPDAAGLLIDKALGVEAGGEDESQVIRVIITHANPRMAQKLANTYVQEFIDFKVGLRSSATGEAARFLQAQVDEKRRQVEELEAELQDFRQQNNLVSVQQDRGILSERLRRLNQTLTEMRIRFLESEGRLRQIEAAGDEIDRLMEIPFIGGSPDINRVYSQLNELRRERKVLDERYLRRHPKIIENEASMQSVMRVLDRVVSQAQMQAETENQALKAEYEAMQRELDVVEQQVLTAERALAEYNLMDRDVEKQRKLLDMLTERYNETQIAQEMSLNVVRMLDPAQLPTRPVAGSKMQVLAAALLLGGFFFAGVPLAMELLDQRLTSFSEIENFVGKPVLGDLREQPKKNFRQIAQSVARGDDDFAEPFRTIFSNLRMRSELAVKEMCFVVTSSVPGEGKSMVCANLARVIASHDYSVLLIDCDVRRPTQHEAFGLDNHHGLVKWFETARKVGLPADPLSDRSLGINGVGENLFLLRSGGTTDAPTEIFGNRDTAELIKRLKDAFDVVIFDTPPVGLFPDATLLADFADECLFVARQFKVNRGKLRYSVNLMDNSRVSVLGVVFNGIRDVNAAVGYGNKAGSSYGTGYEKDVSKYKEYYRRKA
jgi:capsular exopolysaccharide synthesis family protein